MLEKLLIIDRGSGGRLWVSFVIRGHEIGRSGMGIGRLVGIFRSRKAFTFMRQLTRVCTTPILKTEVGGAINLVELVTLSGIIEC